MVLTQLRTFYRGERLSYRVDVWLRKGVILDNDRNVSNADKDSNKCMKSIRVEGGLKIIGKFVQWSSMMFDRAWKFMVEG